ncbi:MAG TPA: 30S ribosomal protein S9 [Patescibacteria group bacterium]|nr:30S ribosomal protein S9 [Patescibacteria group bacterium]
MADTANKQYIATVGRRREAIARVRLYSAPSAKVMVGTSEAKKGDIVVNGKSASEYFNFFAFAPVYNKLFVDTDTAGKYIFSVKVVGGGLAGQAEAMVHGMARALDKLDHDKHHTTLKSKGYLTRDPRTRERRKVGNAGKARRKKSSPKR